jgi:hypothetical protein
MFFFWCVVEIKYWFSCTCKIQFLSVDRRGVMMRLYDKLNTINNAVRTRADWLTCNDTKENKINTCRVFTKQNFHVHGHY